MLLPTRLNMPVLTGLRNLPVKTATAFKFDYPTIELRDVDRTAGLTIVSARFNVRPGFGQPATLTKTITTASTADGQITDAGATDGIGALHIDGTIAEATPWTVRQVFDVTITDSLGRPTPLDAGFLVPVTGMEYDFLPVERIEISPTELTLNFGQSGQIAAIALDANDVALTDRVLVRTSSDTAVATVDSNGVVTPTGVGQAFITVESEGKSSSAILTVPLANFSDTFTRPNGPVGIADTGQSWIIIDGSWVVYLNTCEFETLGTADKRAIVMESTFADCIVSMVVGTVGPYGTRLVLRLSDIDNYLFVDFNGSTLKLVRRVAFVDTVIATLAFVVADDDEISAELSGSAITVSVNGVVKLGPVTETHNVTATRHGLGAYDSAASSIDSFLITV